MRGQVIWFENKLGYGFIRTEDNKELFVHFSNIVMEGYKTLPAEAEVEFEIGTIEKNGASKPQAINVRMKEVEDEAAV